MSNSVCIEPCEFFNVRSGERTYGYRAYDDYEKTYDNNWDKIPDDDLEVLDKAMEEPDDILQGMLDYCQEEEKGIYIGSEYCDWEQIKHLWEIQ